MTRGPLIKTALLLLPLGILLAACSPQEAPPAPVRPVKSLVLKETGPDAVTFAGTVEPQVVTNHSFQILGRMISRNVQVGDAVTKGTLLAVIDSTALEQTLQSARASLTSAEASLSNARATEARQKALLAKNVTSQAAVEDAVQASQAALSARTQAEATVSKAEEQLSYAQLTADYDGVVTSVGAEPGQVVSASATVVTVARPDLRDAMVDLPRSASQDVAIGHAFTVVLQSDPRQTAQGRVRRIEPSADPVTRTQRIRIALQSPPSGFRLGSVISVSLPNSRPPALVLPAAAVFERDGKRFVWTVADGGDTVAAREVTLADGGGDSVSVASGLKSRERVVTAGVHSLSDGQHVRISGDVQ